MNPNDPAFPITDQTIQGYCGLSRRELAAMLAMQGILANSELLRNHKDMDLTELAIKSADDLLDELIKPRKERA